MPVELLIVIGLALVFEFLNGARDSSNIVATMISSRAFSPQSALGLTAAAEFIAPFIFGTVVARTIGGGIAQSNVLSLNMLISCLTAAIIWNSITWYLGIPSSSTHALVGGLLGTVIVAVGTNAIKFDGLNLVLIVLLVSPILGFAAGFMMLRLIYLLAARATPNINDLFKRGQFFTAIALAFSYGTNDAQKTMGIITLGLLISGILTRFAVPTWVILISAAATAMGTLLGGSRLIRTLGGKFYKIRPIHSFATQLTSAVVILGASFFGLPVSTTQVVSSAIIGVGSSETLGKVRWSVADDILTAWVITIPACGLFSAGIYWLVANFT